MIRIIRAPGSGRCASWVPVLLVSALVVTTLQLGSAQSAPPVARRSVEGLRQAANATLDPAALKDFQIRLDGYLRLRETLAKRLTPLSPTASAADLAARQESLAAAIRQARDRANPGDLLTPPVAQYIRTLVTADLKQRRSDEKAGAFEEVPAGVPPVINRTYPASAALATVPPLLLNAMPKLPDNLQYRFYDRHIVLLDGDTEIITDYILNALPPLARNDPDHH